MSWVSSDLFILIFGGSSGASLSETYQGAAREGQTHLRQHVPEVCRAGFKGDRLTFPTAATGGQDKHVYGDDGCQRDWFVLSSPPKQKEAEKAKGERKENGSDEMEVENGEKEAASEAKA